MPYILRPWPPKDTSVLKKRGGHAFVSNVARDRSRPPLKQGPSCQAPWQRIPHAVACTLGISILSAPAYRALLPHALRPSSTRRPFSNVLVAITPHIDP